MPRRRAKTSASMPSPQAQSFPPRPLFFSFPPFFPCPVPSPLQRKGDWAGKKGGFSTEDISLYLLRVQFGGS
jgi:hypothetical protein